MSFCFLQQGELRTGFVDSTGSWTFFARSFVMSGRLAGVKDGAKKKKTLVGCRVRVQCSDGAFYEGAVASWEENKAEYKIVLDDGRCRHSPRPHRLPSPCPSASSQKMPVPDSLDILIILKLKYLHASHSGCRRRAIFAHR